MIKRYWIVIFLFQMLFYKASSQNIAGVDSLLIAFRNAESDTAKFSLLLKVTILYKNNNIDSALKYGNEMLAFVSKIKLSKQTSSFYVKLSEVYLEKGDYQIALQYGINSLKINEQLHNRQGMAESYNAIGSAYLGMKNYAEARYYILNALVINEQLNLKVGVYTNYIHLGIILSHENKPQEAIGYYLKALSIQDELKSTKDLSVTYMNIALCYYGLNDKELAIENIQEAIKAAEEVNNIKYLAVVYGNLGEIYAIDSNFCEAEEAFVKALTYANQLKLRAYSKKMYKYLANIAAEQNEFKKALENIEHVNLLIDSIADEDIIEKAKELEARFDSDQKALQISILENDKALGDEKLKREQHFKMYLSVFGVFVIVLLILLYRNISMKQKSNMAITSAYGKLEEKNNEVTDSINYSKMIQEAILPLSDLKYKLFSEIFILFQPKDIVSGDFYWYAQKNGKKIIACCDCTGHGVPGALMSMIGTNLLNQIINEKGITQADEILNVLDKKIRATLKQEEQQMESKDGMDIAVLVFNSDTEIEYAGANRPLWIVKSANAEFVEVKANKYSIGGSHIETARQFTKHTIALTKGDCIYIFSDGFADQFGGEEGRKFMSKRMKELIISNASKSLVDQEAALKGIFNKWKAKYEQVDDVLVIGIKA